MCGWVSSIVLFAFWWCGTLENNKMKPPIEIRPRIGGVSYRVGRPNFRDALNLLGGLRCQPIKILRINHLLEEIKKQTLENFSINFLCCAYCKKILRLESNSRFSKQSSRIRIPTVASNYQILYYIWYNSPSTSTLIYAFANATYMKIARLNFILAPHQI